MSVHYFHCTDGVSLFADEVGSSLAHDDEIFVAAMRRAEVVMRDLPSHDWSGWLICVYDDLRQMVDVFDFPGLRPLLSLERARAAAASAIRELICVSRRGAAPTASRNLVFPGVRD